MEWVIWDLVIWVFDVLFSAKKSVDNLVLNDESVDSGEREFNKPRGINLL